MHMVPEGRFQLNEHRNQFLVAFHELPAEGIATDQNGDIGPGVTSDRHVVLNLQLVFVRDGILPFTSLISRSCLGFKDTGADIRDLAGAVQIGKHERVFLALEDHAGLRDLDPSTPGELSPDDGLQQRPPVGSFSGLLRGKLPGFVHPKLHRGLVLVDAADHRSIRAADAQLTVFQPVLIGHIFS